MRPVYQRRRSRASSKELYGASPSKLKIRSGGRRAEPAPAPEKGVKMAPIPAKKTKNGQLWARSSGLLCKQTPNYSGNLTFPFEAHKLKLF